MTMTLFMENIPFGSNVSFFNMGFSPYSLGFSSFSQLFPVWRKRDFFFKKKIKWIFSPPKLNEQF